MTSYGPSINTAALPQQRILKCVWERVTVLPLHFFTRDALGRTIVSGTTVSGFHAFRFTRSLEPFGMSALCHKRTHALQHDRRKKRPPRSGLYEILLARTLPMLEKAQ
jgi:hypothetical protein